MNSIPRWATVVGAVVLGTLSLLGVFVSRWEYTTLREDVRVIQGDVKTILWRVGGANTEQVDWLSGVTVVREREIPSAPARLDDLWATAKEIAKKPKFSRPRPLFSFAPYVILMGDRGTTWRLLGMYNPHHNEAIVALLPEESDALFDCVIVHEMLHALLGADEQKVLALWPSCEGK